MRFDRTCADNGIRHLLTVPHSPTTTGKVERFHRTLRAEWVRPHDWTFRTLAEAQAPSTPGWTTTTASGPTASSMRLVVIVRDALYPMIRWDKASTTKATYTMPDHVGQR